jgi:Cu/Zn superoxide dismutase
MGRLEKTLHAKAVITGSGITGEAYLYEEYEGRVRIKVKLDGTPESKLKPGLHAIHIHETGNCEPSSRRQRHRWKWIRQ